MTNTAVAEYLERHAQTFEGSDPRVIALWKEQQEIERMTKVLEERKARYEEDLAALGPYADKNFRVTDMREVRVLDLEAVKKNFPDVWALSEPNDKYKVAALNASMGKDQVNNLVRAHDEGRYDAERTLTLAEFDKATGDSSSKKKFLGIAYHSKFTPTKNTHIESLYKPDMMKFGSMTKPELIEPEED